MEHCPGRGRFVISALFAPAVMPAFAFVILAMPTMQTGVGFFDAFFSDKYSRQSCSVLNFSLNSKILTPLKMLMYLA